MPVLLLAGNYFGTEAQNQENGSCKINVTRYEPLTEIAEHYHENPYLSLLINGNYHEINEKENKLVLPGQILFRPSGYKHANQFLRQGGRCFNIEFKKELLEKHDLSCSLPMVSVVYETGVLEHLYKAMFAFCKYEDAVIADEYIFSWLSANVKMKVSSRLLWMAKVKEILENEFNIHHTIRSVAERVFVHPMYLARAFKEKEGLTFGEYQLKMRLQKAMGLLFKTKGQINEIAHLSGFTDATHLIRSFRLHYQVTPAKFRMALKS